MDTPSPGACAASDVNLSELSLGTAVQGDSFKLCDIRGADARGLPGKEV